MQVTSERGEERISISVPFTRIRADLLLVCGIACGGAPYLRYNLGFLFTIFYFLFFIFYVLFLIFISHFLFI